jgi:hypothetical protein
VELKIEGTVVDCELMVSPSQLNGDFVQVRNFRRFHEALQLVSRMAGGNDLAVDTGNQHEAFPQPAARDAEDNSANSGKRNSWS